MGTAGYMSPEQARGSRVGHRSDVWAFRMVLYAMLTGASTFKGETVSDTLAVLKTDPEIEQVPARFRPLPRRCFDRDRNKRLGWIGEVRGLLDGAAIAEPRCGILWWASAATAAGLVHEPTIRDMVAGDSSAVGAAAEPFRDPGLPLAPFASA